jgi:hypothetical protein
MISEVQKENNSNHLNSSTRRPIKQLFLLCISKALNQKRKEIGHPTIGDISHQGVEEVAPSLRSVH